MAGHPVELSLGAQAGDFAYVRYNYARRLWHERMIVLLVANARHLVSIAKPDDGE